jgi:hypothetical protein
MSVRTLRSIASLASVAGLVVIAIAACGGTVVFEEDGGSDGGGGTNPVQVGPTGTTSASTSFSSPASSGVNGSTGGPTSTGVGPTVAAVSTSSGGGGCEGGLFVDPELDACSQAFCCFEMAACMADPTSCFDPSGRLDPAQPNGDALHVCLVGAGCAGFDGVICDSGLGLDPSDPELLETARCLSESCCEEFNFCTDGGSSEESLQACIECFNDGGTGDRCRPAIDCGNVNCGFGVDT